MIHDKEMEDEIKKFMLDSYNYIKDNGENLSYVNEQTFFNQFIYYMHENGINAPKK